MSALKAYKIYTVDDDLGAQIVFAPNRRIAMRHHPDFWSECEFIERRCNRAPEFDDATQPTPTVAEHLERGWRYPCSWCDRFVWDHTDNRVLTMNRAFCDSECKAKYDAMCRDHGWAVEEAVS